MATVNPDEEIFWSKVREAFNLVSVDHEKEVYFTAGNRQATISWWGERENETGYTIKYDCVMIEVEDYTPPQPALVVPAAIKGFD